MAWCEQCKCCEAQPGFRLCVFCEDGVACPGRQRAQRQQAASVRPVLVHDAVKNVRVPRAKKSVGQNGNRALPADNAGAADQPVGSPESLADTSHAAPQAAPQQSVLTRELSQPGRAGDELTEEPNQIGAGTAKQNAVTAGKDRPRKKERPRMPKTPKEPRYCKCRPGCSEIARSNASPYAKGHNPFTIKNGAQKTAAPATQKTPAPAAGVVTLCVPEAALDTYLTRLPLEEKTAIVQKHLEGFYGHANS